MNRKHKVQTCSPNPGWNDSIESITFIESNTYSLQLTETYNVLHMTVSSGEVAYIKISCVKVAMKYYAAILRNKV